MWRVSITGTDGSLCVLCVVLQLECCSFALIIVTFFLTLVLLYFWSEAQNDYNDFDWWASWHLIALVFKKEPQTVKQVSRDICVQTQVVLIQVSWSYVVVKCWNC